MRRAVLNVTPALVVGLALAAAGCGPDRAPVRLQPELGRSLVYEARRVDDFPDPNYGHGGVLETAVRFRLATVDAVRDRGGKYETTVEAVRVASAPRFGIRIDTDTPEPEGADPLGVEELARGLLQRHGEVTIHANGGFGEVRPDQDVRDVLKAWADEAADAAGRRRRVRVASLLDQMVDGPRVAERTLHSPALLLPSEPYPVEGATWTRTTPTPSPAGLLTCAIEVTCAHDEDGIAVLTGTGTFTCAEPLPEAPLVFGSGTFTAEARLDTQRGVIVAYEEQSTMTFVKTAKDPAGGEGEEITASWTRTLKLVE